MPKCVLRLHRRLAAAIEQDDQNAALIAEHLEAAGDLRSAYEWHMPAGGWSTNRDNAAAQLSWERARQVADALPPTPRTSWRCVVLHAPYCVVLVVDGHCQ